MSNIKHLTKLAESYHLKAVAQQQQKLDQYFTTVSQNIAELATSLVASVKHLLSKPKYQASINLRTIKDSANRLASLANNAVAENADNTLKQYNDLIGGMTFYASSNNAGTGYDPITNIREDGYTEPAYYINNIDTLYRQLQNKYKEQQIPNKSNYIA